MTADRRPAVVGLMVLIGLLFPLMSRMEDGLTIPHPVEVQAAIGKTPEPLGTTRKPVSHDSSAAPSPGLHAPCRGLPTDKTGCADALLAALRAFTYPSDVFATRSTTAEGSNADADCRTISKFAKPTIVAIATLPDPLESGLRYQYDRGLEAIIGGIEARGYQRDRFFLPWSRDTQESCADELPGVLMFRPPSGDAHGASPPPSPIVVFVLGETPTWGIHRAALYTALNFARENVEADSAPPTIRIVGPYFSGSAVSLRETIDAWYAERQADVSLGFRLISGTASHPDNPRRLESGSSPTVTYQTTTLPDDILEREFYAYLQHVVGAVTRDGSSILPGVALLSESGTTYGSQRDGDDPDRPVVRPEVTVRFPLHIAAVRAQYQHLRPENENPGNTIPHTSLEPIFDDPAERTDSPAILS